MIKNKHLDLKSHQKIEKFNKTIGKLKILSDNQINIL